jgi:hypothetical protein
MPGAISRRTGLRSVTTTRAAPATLAACTASSPTESVAPWPVRGSAGNYVARLRVMPTAWSGNRSKYRASNATAIPTLERVPWILGAGCGRSSLCSIDMT